MPTPYIEKNPEQGGPAFDDVLALQHRASEAVINANVDPSLLTLEEHEDVTALQALANLAATEANLLLLS